ncbi:MAG: formylglycine-generating enzyme family protein [Planctomycetia bacterium]|nr:formylglycine-generating enzyme family protein [Planctomycetia bacterium]
MKKALILLFLLTLPTLIFAEETLRTWRSKTGVAIIEAAWDSTNDPSEEFVFLLKGERRYRIPLENLSEEDKKYVSDGRMRKLAEFGLVDVTNETPKDVRPQEVASPPVSDGRSAGERMVRTIWGVEYAFRWCPAGSFMMGSPPGGGQPSENPQHLVTLTKGFWMLETEVTQAMWERVMGSNPSHFKRSNLPVESVNWLDCTRFCEKISELSGLKIQLPTEAQWEYACRAGTTTAFSFGNTLFGGKANCDGNSPDDANSLDSTKIIINIKRTTPVGSYSPNAWGLYDMHGNVWEWCSDWYGSGYYATSPTSDPNGPESGSQRVFRGGSWGNSAEFCRSALRRCDDPTYSCDHVGFRLIFVP